MKLGKLILALPLVAVLALLGACSKWQKVEPGMELRSYSVPAASREQIESALRQALTLKNATEKNSAEVLGKVAVVDQGGGVLLVSAPPGIQRDIARFLEQYRPAERASEPRVAIDFWVVMADGRPGATNSDRQLNEISEALEVIHKAQGLQGFTLVERLSINHEQGEQEIQGARVRVEMSGVGPGISRVEIEVGHKDPRPGDRGAELETLLKLEPGKTVVLGQSGFPAQPSFPYPPSPAVGTERVSLFYVVRTRALD